MVEKCWLSFLFHHDVPAASVNSFSLWFLFDAMTHVPLVCIFTNKDLREGTRATVNRSCSAWIKLQGWKVWLLCIDCCNRNTVFFWRLNFAAFGLVATSQHSDRIFQFTVLDPLLPSSASVPATAGSWYSIETLRWTHRTGIKRQAAAVSKQLVIIWYLKRSIFPSERWKPKQGVYWTNILPNQC